MGANYASNQVTTIPSAFCSKVQITASSSIGLRVHVEYTMRPPVASISTARARIRSCILKTELIPKHLPFY